jgi:transposase
LIRERQREGITLARQRGAYRGRARALSAEQVAQLRQRVADGTTKATLAREFGVSRETIYQYLRSTGELVDSPPPRNQQSSNDHHGAEADAEHSACTPVSKRHEQTDHADSRGAQPNSTGLA